jgi:hypothetical protein
MILDALDTAALLKTARAVFRVQSPGQFGDFEKLL